MKNFGGVLPFISNHDIIYPKCSMYAILAYITLVDFDGYMCVNIPYMEHLGTVYFGMLLLIGF